MFFILKILHIEIFVLFCYVFILCCLFFCFVLAFCLVFKKGGDKLTLSLNGGITAPEETKQPLDEQPISESSPLSKDDRKRCATPVTVTHFSFGEYGKLEQRVISPERSPTESMSSIVSLPSFNATSPTSPCNPFSANPFTGDHQTTPTNPFLSPLSNPFTDNSIKKDSTNGVVVAVVESNTGTQSIANSDTKVVHKVQVCLSPKLVYILMLTLIIFYFTTNKSILNQFTNIKLLITF